uniref:Uncharacterized protein n=1 Tax=Cacopsylla melanoneura TaxID=428564 RepID=A0A8D9B7E7_9HEMI
MNSLCEWLQLQHQCSRKIREEQFAKQKYEKIIKKIKTINYKRIPKRKKDKINRLVCECFWCIQRRKQAVKTMSGDELNMNERDPLHSDEEKEEEVLHRPATGAYQTKATTETEEDEDEIQYMPNAILSKSNTQADWNSMVERLEKKAIEEQKTKKRATPKKQVNFQTQTSTTSAKAAKKSPTKRITPIPLEPKVTIKKPKIQIEMTQEQQIKIWEKQPYNFANLLVLLWEDEETPVHLLKFIRALSKETLLQGDVDMKKKCLVWKTGIEIVLQETGYENVSWPVFRKELQGTAFYTTFIKDNLSPEWIKNCMRLYNQVSSEEQSSSKPVMETTTTSSMIARGRPASAGVASYNVSKTCAAVGGRGPLFGGSNCPSTTSTISSFISRVVDGQFTTYKSDVLPPGAEYLVKCEIYEIDAIKKLEKQQWWKVAKLRTLCASSSSAKVMNLAGLLSEAIEEQMDAEMQPIRREQKEMHSWRS